MLLASDLVDYIQALSILVEFALFTCPCYLYNTQSLTLNSFFMMRLSHLSLVSSWYFSTCLVVCSLISSTSCFSCARTWSFTHVSNAKVQEVGNMISVGSTASMPYARWKGDKHVECFGVVQYAHNSVGSSFTQLPFVALSFLFRVASRVLLDASVTISLGGDSVLRSCVVSPLSHKIHQSD